MSLGVDYPVINTGNVKTVIDTYIAPGAPNVNGTSGITNGAFNTPGIIYQYQPQPFLVNSTGAGSPRFLKYVRYNPTASQAIPAGPTLVYWKDETFTAVTGLASEALGGATLSMNFIAGWMLPNTTDLPSVTAATLNGNWCFIQVGGFLSGAYMGGGVTATVGARITVVASTGVFVTTPVAAGTPAPLTQVAGYVLTASVTNLSDIYIPFLN